ncbi:Long-chain fatty acid transport protein 4 [Trichostrongylus colubriformis]|uniref:long-chain-fatty-acid--CoA ligase n=1 Tax=Trichostrongylus colubriformis TaxID=6319 RepID=A0AAN8IK60_TRICO
MSTEDPPSNILPLKITVAHMPDTPSDALWRIAAFAFIMLLSGRDRWWIVFILYSIYRLTRTELFDRIRQTIRRDLSGIYLLIRVKLDIKRRLNANRPIHEVFLEKVRKHPQKLACIEVETGRQITYDELNRLTNRYANYFDSLGYKKGDVAALYMENCIDFLALWLGLSKIGVVSAFINSHLKLEPLAYSINVAKCRAIITCTALLPTLRQSVSHGSLNITDKDLFVSDGIADDAKSLSAEIRAVAETEPVSRNVHFQDVLCYVYTSGTTGNPKPAVIKHFRYYFMAMGAGKAFDIVGDDIVYITMPLYHSAAGIMGIGSVIVYGTTAVIRKKFSASNFWKDCVKYNCTASQYIGEICRYLLAQKPCEEETKHRVRLMWGNGLRAEIWNEFVSRFGIKRIGELYGSTEGNSNIVNIDNHVGSCGFFPIYPHIGGLYPVRLIKVDQETGELIRDAKGLCIPCRPGELGEMVGVIKKKDLLLKFEGYVDKGDTQKKIYRDVFAHGDQVFASGDILYWDKLGYLYFKDRRGDTFRWKGENVSTTEVESILQPVMSVVDATVYGVEVGKNEGRAGMAAIVLGDDVNVEEFMNEIAKKLRDNLASYAIPVFIRLCKEVDRTATFKLKKLDLQKQGFDLKLCKGDPVYYWNSSIKGYSLLDAQMQKDIETGVYNRI